MVRSINHTLLVALDGTDSVSSEKISCPCCTEQTLKNGKTLFRHIVVTPVIVAPGQKQVIPLPAIDLPACHRARQEKTKKPESTVQDVLDV